MRTIAAAEDRSKKRSIEEGLQCKGSVVYRG